MRQAFSLRMGALPHPRALPEATVDEAVGLAGLRQAFSLRVGVPPHLGRCPRLRWNEAVGLEGGARTRNRPAHLEKRKRERKTTRMRLPPSVAPGDSTRPPQRAEGATPP